MRDLAVVARREEIINQLPPELLESRVMIQSLAVTLTRKLVLPDIEPEDLSVPRPMLPRRRPIRRGEVKIETVGTGS